MGFQRDLDRLSMVRTMGSCAYNVKLMKRKVGVCSMRACL